MPMRPIAPMKRIREYLGYCVCRLRGHILPNVIDIEPGIDRFYPCPRCGRCSVSNKTFSAWYNGEPD